MAHERFQDWSQRSRGGLEVIYERRPTPGSAEMIDEPKLSRVVCLGTCIQAQELVVPCV